MRGSEDKTLARSVTTAIVEKVPLAVEPAVTSTLPTGAAPDIVPVAVIQPPLDTEAVPMVKFKGEADPVFHSRFSVGSTHINHRSAPAMFDVFKPG
jgi:hypothetical protein